MTMTVRTRILRMAAAGGIGAVAGGTALVRSGRRKAVEA